VVTGSSVLTAQWHGNQVETSHMVDKSMSGYRPGRSKVKMGHWRVGQPEFKLFPIFKFSSLLQIQNHCPLKVQSYLNIAWGYIWTWWTTSSIRSTSNSHWITCYKIWNRFKFECSMNFKGVQTLWEKSRKSSKILTWHAIHKSEFSWAHLYARFLSSNTSVKRHGLKIMKRDWIWNSNHTTLIIQIKPY
jgi:hypothetical protein